jgi:hypothetical protein
MFVIVLQIIAVGVVTVLAGLGALICLSGLFTSLSPSSDETPGLAVA